MVNDPNIMSPGESALPSSGLPSGLRLPTAPTAPWARRQSSPPTLVLTAEATQVAQIIAQLQEHTRTLHRINNLAVRHTRDAVRYLGLIRAASSLARVMRNSRNTHYTQAASDDLVNATQQLHQAATNNANWQAPLEVTHPALHRRRNSAASAVLDVIRDPASGRAVQRLSQAQGDSAVTRALLEILYQSIAQGCAEVEKTPRQARMCDLIETGLAANDDSNLIGVVKDRLEPLSNTLELASLSLMGAYARRQLIEGARAAAEARRGVDEVMSGLERLTTLSSDQRSMIRNAVSHGDEASMLRAEQTLQDNLNSAPAIDLVKALMSYLALLELLTQTRQPREQPLEWGLRTVHAGAEAVMSTITVFNNLGVAHQLSRTGLVNALTDVAELAEGAIGGAAAVFSIVDGCHNISAAFAGHGEVEDVMVGVGGSLQIASGLVLGAAILMSAPGLQPGGIALGVAGAVLILAADSRRAHQNINDVIMRRILEQLQEDRARYARNPPLYAEQLRITGEIAAVVQAAGRWTHWCVRISPPSAASGSHVQQNYDVAVRHDLQNSSFPVGVANQMLSQAP